MQNHTFSGEKIPLWKKAKNVKYSALPYNINILNMQMKRLGIPTENKCDKNVENIAIKQEVWVLYWVPFKTVW
ncbi:hypothetical protein [Listeria seeligeri]|uniref:hypothetical protein n=1 Tax=Listeria seeligeri TaxID=1640 RepID=UPI0010D34E87|nr:hypothetical protein [Listeria seeligeri]MBC1422175.1 hypothetical protein [Listeria seeligeri]MBC1423087.1 hypothetical protein [Listeria seeligeri]MBC1442375.1 hypothetical protein [Listeria seeligeri]MBC1471476.1 hypothetical protein [Listeria seeligeri]MBC1481024.1 hypothetical protein [Listeria seeligeri]